MKQVFPLSHLKASHPQVSPLFLLNPAKACSRCRPRGKAAAALRVAVLIFQQMLTLKTQGECAMISTQCIHTLSCASLFAACHARLQLQSGQGLSL